jgi:hypothetical protein
MFIDRQPYILNTHTHTQTELEVIKNYVKLQDYKINMQRMQDGY